MAEFETPEALLTTARAAQEAGYDRVEAYAPYPVKGLPAAVGHRRNRVPLFVLLGGLTGAGGAYFMQWYANLISYPLNVGGRPLHSWPSFIPITFELTILIAAFAALISMLALNGLPQLYHPVFNTPAFVRASQDRFFLCIEADDAQFDPDATRRFLRGHAPIAVHEVEP
jgi:hypothetical protein